MARMSRGKKFALVGTAAAVVLLGLVGVAAAAKPDDEGGDTREPWPDPLPEPDPKDEKTAKLVDIAICACIDEGVTGEHNLALCAASVVWEDIPWPPIAGDHQSLHDAWSLVEERVQSFAKALGQGKAKQWCNAARGIVDPLIAKPVKPKPEDPGDPGTKLRPKPEEPDEPKPPPPPDIPKWEVTYPKDGAVYQILRPDIMLGQDPDHSIIFRALWSASYLAAKEVGGVGDTEANAFARGIAMNANKRLQYLNLVLCSAWNDFLYGTWGYGEKAWPGPHGRSIRLLSYHADNRARMEQGLPPIRNIMLGSPVDKGTGNAVGAWNELQQEYEFIWLVPLDYVALFERGEIEVDPIPWEGARENEESKMFPPPEFMALGLVSAADVPDQWWGCEGHPQIYLGE